MTKNTVSHQDTASALAVVGSRLKEMRVQQGLQLESIASRTQIHLKHLVAIEAGNLIALPEPIYIRGFIRKYAQCLNLDSAVLEEEFMTAGEHKKTNKRTRNISNNLLKVGGIPQKIQYWIYGVVVVGIGSGLVYLNNANFSAEPVQSSVSESVANK